MFVDRLNLKGKNAAILGGAGGIGRAVTLALAAEGVNIAMCDKNPDYLAQTKKDVEVLGVECFALEANVLSTAAIDEFFNQTADWYPWLNILINLAGGVRQRDFLTSSDEEDAEDIRRNYGYVIQSIMRGVPLIKKSGIGGCIINFTTIESRCGAAQYSVYAGAKAATMNLTRALAVELAPKKIRVNEIIPDTTWSEGNAVAFLVSDLARMLTGIRIPVDGGTGAAMGFLKWPYDEGFGPCPIGKAASKMYSGIEASS